MVFFIPILLQCDTTPQLVDGAELPESASLSFIMVIAALLGESSSYHDGFPILTCWNRFRIALSLRESQVKGIFGWQEHRKRQTNGVAPV